MGEIEGVSVDLSSLGGPSFYSQPGDSAPRALSHSDEAFLLSGSLSFHSHETFNDNSTKARAWATGRPEHDSLNGTTMKNNSPRSTSLVLSATTRSYQGDAIEGITLTSFWQNLSRFRDHRLKWHPSFSMYICFIVGFLCAAGHHIFYATLDGKLAESQTEMLRYGTILAYAAKSGFSAAVVSALKQRTWLTVRRKFVSIHALDGMFAAAEDILAMFHLEFLRDAKGAFALAFFAWTTPLVVSNPFTYCYFFAKIPLIAAVSR